MSLTAELQDMHSQLAFANADYRHAIVNALAKLSTSSPALAKAHLQGYS